MPTNPGTVVYDISATLRAGATGYPGDPPFELDPFATLDGGPYRLTRLAMSAHAGSHLDFPSHVVPGGKSAADYPASAFLLPALVVEAASGGRPVSHGEILRAGIVPGDAVLFRTGGRGFLTPEAARACVGAEARIAGIDSLSVDRSEDADLPVHRILLGNDVLVLEGLDLSAVPAGRYTLSCLPLRIAGCEASPVRAVLLGS